MNHSNPVWTTNDHGEALPHISNQAQRDTDERSTKSSATFHNPFLVAVQSKFRRKYYHKIIFAILIVIILILLIAIICIALKVPMSSKMCNTKECLRSAANLLLTMDQSVDPCEDFYKFTCGHWSDEHPRPDTVTSYDWFSEKQTKITRQIRKFLQSNTSTNDPSAVKKVKTMYKACVNVEEIDKLGISPIFRYLKEYGLPLIPSGLNISQHDNESSNFDWVESIAKIKRGLGMDILIGFDIFPNPENRSINRIALGTPETESPLPFNDGDTHRRMKKAQQKFIVDQDTDEEEDDDEVSPAVSAYISYIRKVILVIIATANPDISLDELVEGSTNAAMETIRINKHFYKINEDAENTTKGSQNPLDDLIYLTLAELQNHTDELVQPSSVPIWDKYLRTIFNNLSDSNIDVNSEKYLTSRADIKYLQNLALLISETPKKNVELYLWWNVVEELILHTTSELRQLHNEYTRIVIKTEGSTTRSIYCTTGVNSLLGMAVSYAIADENFLKHTQPKVENMLKNIRQAFNSLVKATNWMDEATKIETLKKSATMQSFIGFPEWILNKTRLDIHYHEINVTNSTHLDNMMGILKWQMKRKLLSLKRNNTFGWATAPSNVNAFHTFQANTITIPIAILQYPFYELGLEALNYGAIGTILGHELTHGFDDSGRMFDKSGNLRQWWSNRTITEYVNRTSCFVKQYSNFYMPDINEHINGDLTLGENIADNGGLREAYYAYKILVKKIGEEKYLPGLENYTHEQLLFIAFGNLWCETYTPAGTRYALEDSHCPGQIRLKGVLSNSPEFSRAFGCTLGSGMYPSEDRCRIW